MSFKRKKYLMTVGIVAFAFAKRDKALEPNPSNIALGNETARSIRQLRKRRRDYVGVYQWEVTLRLRQLSLMRDTDVNVTHDDARDERYLDSKDVWNVAKRTFEARGVTEVVVMAQSFIHLDHLRKMVEADGFTVIRTHFFDIPFDPSPLNRQWWCRGKVHLLAYAALQVPGGVIEKVTGSNPLSGIGERR